MGVKQLPDGRWRIDYRDQFGKRYRKMFTKERAAQRALHDAERAVEQGAHVAPTNLPTFAEMAEQWFANKRTLRPATVDGYRTHLENHLLPELGPLRLNQVDVDAMERFRDALLADTEKGLGAVTVNKVMTTAAAIFRFAEKRKKCSNNPAALADRLHVSEEIVDEGGDVHRVSRRAVSDEDVLTADEIQKLLRHAKTGLPYTLLLTAAATGCRHNELLALRWQDIDFEGGAVHVRRSLTWVRGGEGESDTRVPKFYPPKTETGRRKVPAPPELLQALRRWFLQTHFKAAGDLVFPTRTGQPRHHRTVRRDVLERTRKRAGVRRFTMHSLRHSFASSLLEGGASIAEVQKYMGHKTPAVTLNVYAHFLPTEDTGAVAAHVCRIFPVGHFLDTSAASDSNPAPDDAVSA